MRIFAATAVVAGAAFAFWFLIIAGPGAESPTALMRRFLDYYRQFEELSPEEISRDLRERATRSARRRSTEVPPLDLARPALARAARRRGRQRRDVRAAPRASTPTRTAAPLREALAARHGVDAGAGRRRPRRRRAAARRASGALAGGGEVAVAWPGWGPLPRLVARGRRHARCRCRWPRRRGRRRRARRRDGRTRARSCCAAQRPDRRAGRRRRAARLAPARRAGVADRRCRAGRVRARATTRRPCSAARERVIVVRSFSKAHAMAGFRAGYALGPTEAARAAGAGSRRRRPRPRPGSLWAVADGERGRRRAAARPRPRERERLAAALEGTPFSFPRRPRPARVARRRPRTTARRSRPGLAAQRIYVTPGSAVGRRARTCASRCATPPRPTDRPRADLALREL